MSSISNLFVSITEDGHKDRACFSCLLDASCSSIAGTYGNGAAKIDFDKGHLHGKWEKNSRPDFKGTIEANCKGRMRFPDHRVFTLEYDPKLKKIFWDGRNSGNVWTKGRFESVFVMSINITKSFFPCFFSRYL